MIDLTEEEQNKLKALVAEKIRKAEESILRRDRTCYCCKYRLSTDEIHCNNIKRANRNYRICDDFESAVERHVGYQELNSLETRDVEKAKECEKI